MRQRRSGYSGFPAFGIRTPEDAATVAAKADGVVVGSAVVRRIAAAGSLEEAKASVAELVRGLAAACRRP